MTNHIPFSIFLQVLGILINGIVGMSLEVFAQLITSFEKKNTRFFILQKLVIIILSQALFDIIFGDGAIFLECSFLFLEKNIKMLLSFILILKMSWLIRLYSFPKKDTRLRAMLSRVFFILKNLFSVYFVNRFITRSPFALIKTK